jgi:hypothetical protein
MSGNAFAPERFRKDTLTVPTRSCAVRKALYVPGKHLSTGRIEMSCIEGTDASVKGKPTSRCRGRMDDPSRQTRGITVDVVKARIRLAY